jgi:hypothetical protein
MKNKVKVLAMVLCCALVLGNISMPAAVAQAKAKKAAISETELTIPVGDLNSKTYWNKSSWETENAKKLSVDNAVKGAVYQFTSSNSKVAGINKKGGYLTGLKAGKATITCTQIYNNKKVTVGKCKVVVKKAALSIYDKDMDFPVGTSGYDLAGYYSGLEPVYNITFRNPKATYTLKSDNDNFVIQDIKYDASKANDVTDNAEYASVLKDYIGDRYFYGYKFTAKVAGTYTVTVKETYKNKTTTLGSFKVNIKDTSIAEAQKELLLGNKQYASELLNYTKENTDYYFEIKDYDEKNPDKNVLKMGKDDQGVYVYGNKAGTADVTVKEGSATGTVIGTVTFTVTELPCKEIILDSKEFTTTVGEDFSIYYDLNPSDTTDKVTISSDNTKVLKVEYNAEEGYWAYTSLKAGTANITIQCGSQSVVCKVVVEK